MPTTIGVRCALMISQEYFDEVCLENVELFDLCEEEALKATVDQLRSTDSAGTLDHLTLTFPTSAEGQKERSIMEKIKNLVESMSVSDEGNVREESLRVDLESVLVIMESDSDHVAIERRFFLCYNGMAELVGRIHMIQKCSESQRQLLELWINCIIKTLGEKTSKKMLSQFQTCVASHLEPIAMLYRDNQDDPQILGLLLDIMVLSIKRNEPNKKEWMKIKLDNQNLPQYFVETLKKCICEEFTAVGDPLCQFLTNLCTYDDFSNRSNAPTVASTHTNVQTLVNYQVVPKLHAYLEHVHTAKHGNPAPAIWCLRSIAIQDSTVQTIVALGVLQTVGEVLTGSSEDDVDTVQVVTAILGLFRNLCGNDDIKTTLCLGGGPQNSESMVPSLLQYMEKYPDEAVLQEHACGTIGAMALRKVANAEFLIKENAHAWVVRAMQRHLRRATLQRQACLALRNLVSRLPPDAVERVRQQEPIEEALNAAAKCHDSCQDEVYAALRELGVSVTRCQVLETANGETVLQPTEMFGQAHNSNFRAVFE